MAIEEIRCKFCNSGQLQRLTGEIALRSPGMQNLENARVYVSAEMVLCLNCGTVQFAVPQAQLRQLAKGAAAAG